ncbi:hypothetical protein BurJ1DRAFT_0584, partial [Burkholderiales bacterium JOSHI_001]
APNQPTAAASVPLLPAPTPIAPSVTPATLAVPRPAVTPPALPALASPAPVATESLALPAARAEPAVATPAPLAAPAPGASTPPAPAAPTPAVPSSANPGPAPLGNPLATPVDKGPALPGAGTPDAGARLGREQATPPMQPASAPRLNLELARPRGGEISSSRSGTGVLQLMPRPPEVKDKLARDIENAARKDCKDAYAGAGLLAVVPLARDAVRGDNKGCRW